MSYIAPVPKLQFFDANGNPLSGGKLYTYAAGTTTPQATYTDSSGNTPNTNPVILDSRGEASVWLSDLPYKLKLTTSADVEIWTVDNISSAASLSALAASGGAALIGAISTGAGAVTRTVQSKLRDRISIFDYIPESEHAAIKNGTSTYDCYPAITAALAANTYQSTSSSFYTGCKEIFFPHGQYRIGTTINLKQEVILTGEGGFVGSILLFDADLDGIIVNNYNTQGRGAGSGYAGYRSVIQNLRLASNGGTTGRGISLRARAFINNVQVSSFPEEGVYAVATAGGSPSTEGNANCFVMQNVYSTNNGSHGFLFDGADANAGVCLMCSSENNAGHGFYDASFLGNTFIACHADANGGRSYYSDDSNARSTFIGCYAEGGQTAARISASSNVYGGLLADGVTSDGGFSVRGSVADGFLRIYPTGATDGPLFARLGGPSSAGYDPLMYFFNAKDFSAGQGFGYAAVFSGYTYANNVRNLLCMTQNAAGTGALAGWMTGGRGSLQTNSLFVGPMFLGTQGSTWNGGERMIQYGSAAPTTGTYAQGDIVFNNAPTSGGYVGWVCTAGGTPGTWKTFGLIS